MHQPRLPVTLHELRQVDILAEEVIAGIKQPDYTCEIEIEIEIEIDMI